VILGGHLATVKVQITVQELLRHKNEVSLTVSSGMERSAANYLLQEAENGNKTT
jgi:hypothetical protein